MAAFESEKGLEWPGSAAFHGGAAFSKKRIRDAPRRRGRRRYRAYGALRWELAFCQRKYIGLFNCSPSARARPPPQHVAEEGGRGRTGVRRIGKATGKDCRRMENGLGKVGNSPENMGNGLFRDAVRRRSRIWLFWVHRGFVGRGKGNQSFQLWSHISKTPPLGSQGMSDQDGLITIDTPFPTNPQRASFSKGSSVQTNEKIAPPSRIFLFPSKAFRILSRCIPFPDVFLMS